MAFVLPISPMYCAESGVEATLIKNVPIIVSIILLFSSMTGCFYKHEEQKIKIPQLPKIDPSTITLPNGEIVDIKKIGIIGYSDEEKQRVYVQARRCFDSVCKEQPESFLYTLNDINYYLTKEEKQKLDAFQRVFDEQLKPKIEKIMDDDFALNRQKNLEVTLTFKALFEILDKVQLSNIVEKVTKFFVLQQMLQKYKPDDYDLTEYLRTKKITLKKEVFSEVEPSEVQNVNLALAAYTRFLNDYANGPFSAIADIGLRGFLGYYYDPNDLPGSMVRFSDLVKIYIDLVREVSPVIAEIYENNYIIKKVLLGGHLRKSEESILAEKLASLSFFKDLTEEEWPELETFELDAAKALSKENFVTYLSKVEKTYSLPGANEFFEIEKKRVLEVCRPALSAHLASRPSKSQISETEDLIDKINIVGPSIARKLFPDQANQEIFDLLVTSEFDLPKDDSGTLETLKSELDELYPVLTSNRFDNVNLTDSRNSQDVVAVMKGLSEVTSDNKIGFNYEDLVDFCTGYLPEALSDSYVSVNDQIRVSSVTVKAGESGLSILAHELGHRLYNEIDSPLKVSTSQCLMGRHKESQTYLGEDFADHFAGLVLKVLGENDPKLNTGCQLFFNSNATRIPDGKRVELFNEFEPHPLYPMAGDVHSARLWRLIQMAQDLGHMTPECTEFKDSERDKIYVLSTGEFITIPNHSVCE